MEHFTGVLHDPRTEEEKAKDWSHDELGFAGTPYTWKEFKEEDVPKYTIRNQNGSGMCGPFSGVKALGIRNKKRGGNYVDLLPPFIYKLRTNQSAGMWLQQLLEVMGKYGAPLDTELKGDNLNEEQANSYKTVPEMFSEAAKYAGGKYAFINPQDIDEIARVVDLGWTPILLLRCDISEWTTEPYFNPKFKAPFNINHFNPVIYCGLRNGVKTFVTDDSWGSSYGKNGHRFLSEEFIKNRVEAIGYIFDLPEEDKPRYTFKSVLTYGMKHADVKALQEVLKFEGCMDKSIPSTGNYLNITAQGVMKLQLKNQIASVSEITSLGGRRVGVKTLTYLNSKYGNL